MNIKKLVIRYAFLSLILILIQGKNVFALGESEVRFNNLTLKDGLSQSTVNKIIQDNKGYMWFGTSDGLNKYNGHEFVIFRELVNDKKSINSSFISALIEYDNDNILVGTSKGISKINVITNEVSRMFEDEEGKSKLSNNNIWDILKHSDGTIWIATRKGLNIYNPKTGDMYQIFKDTEPKGLKSNVVTSLCEDKYGNVWVGTSEGLSVINTKTKEIQPINDILDNDNSAISNIYRDRDDNIWIVTDNHIMLVSSNYKDITYFDKELESFKISPDSVNAIYEDKYNNLWISTQNGLLEYNKENKKMHLFESRYYDDTSLVNDNVLTAYEDRSGLLWFGTYNGISLLNHKQPFKHYRREPDKENTISDNSMSGIYKDSDGMLWLGTNSAGLNKLNTMTGEVTNFYSNNSDENTLSSNVVWQICEADKDNLWVATQGGVNKINKKSGNVERLKYPDNMRERNKMDARNVFVDKDGLLWIGARGGLQSYDDKTGTFTDYSNVFKAVGIVENAVTSISQDEEGFLWITIGIDGGVVKFDKDKGVLKSYLNNSFDSNSLINNGVRCLEKDSKGNVWIGTEAGLSKLDSKTDKFTNYTVVNGLANNFIYGILIDEEDNLWISTNDGLSRFDQKTNKFINYTAMDGLQSNEFNGRSYFKSKDGEMFFGGINGVTAFYPKDVLKLSDNRNKSKVVIDEIKVNNKTYPYYGGTLSLKYNENNISIDFFLPDYLNTTKTTYEYKLEGVDEEWTFANKRNNANYATLDSGTYKVLIRARDNHGDLTPVTALDLKIAPPPWRTPTAYLIYFSSAVIVIFLMWSYVTALEKTVKKRAEQLKKEAKEKEKLYIEKEKLYKEAADLKDEMIKRQKFKNDYFVNLSHELRTPLNVILATVQLIKLKNKEDCLGKYQVEDYTNTLRNNANHLLKIINDIIDSSKIESGAYKLNIEKQDIVSLVEDTALSLKAYIEENNLDIIIDPEIEELDVECDKNEIERCVINLLSNAIKYTHGHGTIEVFIRECENETVEIAIKDTGVGISKEQQKIIFDRFVQADSISKKQYRSSGIGLTLVKSIIELHHGTIRVESELNKGSTFIITLPIRQEKSK
ncbi:ligand-binding sensor domain-containing protein [Clostridium perfringens]|uniref:ligand-binding sensor domain-containing protein n=1 Tax=Clostridium perfringens TaxID=1502 RepID=UPI001CCEB49E|nr:sensor histidine kinase [Clostridium perfringens]UBK27962.1 histidine kinase [Clostridium perfringens]